MVYNGKSQSKMDDLRVPLWLRNPPFADGSKPVVKPCWDLGKLWTSCCDILPWCSPYSPCSLGHLAFDPQHLDISDINAQPAKSQSSGLGEKLPFQMFFDGLSSISTVPRVCSEPVWSGLRHLRDNFSRFSNISEEKPWFPAGFPVHSGCKIEAWGLCKEAGLGHRSRSLEEDPGPESQGGFQLVTAGPPKCLVYYQGTSQSKMDEKWGYP